MFSEMPNDFSISSNKTSLSRKCTRIRWLCTGSIQKIKMCDSEGCLHCLWICRYSVSKPASNRPPLRYLEESTSGQSKKSNSSWQYIKIAGTSDLCSHTIRKKTVFLYWHYLLLKPRQKMIGENSCALKKQSY